MPADLFEVTGIIKDLKINISQLNKEFMEKQNMGDVDWRIVNRLAKEIKKNATYLQDEAESELQ